MAIASSILALLPVVPDRGTSTLILFTLIVIFAASWWTFGVLVGRSTEQRHRVAMGQWGRERGLRFQTISTGDLPPPLDVVKDHGVNVPICLASKREMLLLVESAPANPPTTQGPTAAPLAPRHFLIVPIRAFWPPTGLRPVAATASVVDLYSLTSFPLLGGSERFVLYGADSIAAAALSRSSARGLLPADIGLLLHGRHLLLDFSARPFDTIEFERMMVVAQQVVEHLPQLSLS